MRQELPNRNTYFTDSDEKVYIDIRRSKGFTGEFERVNRDDSDLIVTVDLKKCCNQKNEAIYYWVLSSRVFIYAN